MQKDAKRHTHQVEGSTALEVGHIDPGAFLLHNNRLHSLLLEPSLS